jgi:hypothetical protein
MAGVLHRFEQRLETAVTSAFAKAFRSAVQPVEIAAALQREVDNSSQVMSRNRRLAPNVFEVELSTTDHERMASFGAALINELSTMVREHVAEQHYTLAGALEVHLVPSGELGTGRFRVRSSTNAAVQPPDQVAASDARVVLEVGGHRHAVDGELVVGRSGEADLRIDDPGISRRHARIQVHDTGDGLSVTINDLESTNGVVVDGRKVISAVLSDRSEVRLGNTLLTVRISPEDGGTS